METTARRASCGASAATVVAPAKVGGGLNAKGSSLANGESDDLYVVGKILAEKTENGMAYFKVRWKNYPPSNDTWEPEHNLSVVADMIEAFRTSRANRLGQRPSSGGGGNSRKRPAPKKWDQGPASNAATNAGVKAKLIDELDEDRAKFRRRLNGGSGSGAGRDSGDASEDTAGEEGNSNNSEGGSSFANSVGSSSTVEMEGRQPVVAAAATAAPVDIVVAKDAASSSSASGSIDSGCQMTATAAPSPAQTPTPPPPAPQPASATTPTKPQQFQSPLLADLLGSAKRETVVPDASESCDTEAKPTETVTLTATPTATLTTPSSAIAPAAVTPTVEDADCRYVTNQAELLRAHVAGQAARLPPNRPPPLAWPLLCQAVERGDWPAVSRTISTHQLTAADVQWLLCLAVGRGHACIVDLLLDAGASSTVDSADATATKAVDIDYRSAETGLTLLMLAVERDSPALVHRLLLAGADPNLVCPAGNSALQRAVRQRRPHIVDALCSLGGVDFGAETCEGQTPLRYARRVCPQSAAVLQLYVGHLCRTMYDHLADHLARLGFAPAALLFAPRYLRPRPGRTCQVQFHLPADEASRHGHALALIHCRQRPCSALMRRQPCPDPMALHCWLSDGPCHVDSVSLSGAGQRSLTACGAPFLTALTGPAVGENSLSLTFASTATSPAAAGNFDGGSGGVCGVRVGVFAFRLAPLPPPESGSAADRP